ncbi:hypothetical protein D3C80_1469430 [compost metagenome]
MQKDTFTQASLQPQRFNLLLILRGFNSHAFQLTLSLRQLLFDDFDPVATGVNIIRMRFFNLLLGFLLIAIQLPDFQRQRVQLVL